MTWFKSLVMRQNSPLLLIDSRKQFISSSSSQTSQDTLSLSSSIKITTDIEQPKRQTQVRLNKVAASVEWTPRQREEVAQIVSIERGKGKLILPELRLPKLVQCPYSSYEMMTENKQVIHNKKETAASLEISPKNCHVVKDNNNQNYLVNTSQHKENLKRRSNKLSIKEVNRGSLRRSAANRSRKKKDYEMLLPVACSQLWSKHQFSRILIAITLFTLYTLTCCFVAHAANPVGQQYFEVEPDAQYLVQNGQDARIRCLIRNRQGECLWLRNGRAIGAIQKKYVFSRQPENGDCSLIIRNVSVQQDDGLWHCQVTASDVEQDTLQSREVHLIVLVAPERPQIKNTSQHTHRLIVEENKTKTVVCEMRGGNPPPQIEWILDSKNITKEAQSSSSMAPSTGSQQTGNSGNQQQRITQSKLRIADIKRTMNGKNLTCVGVHQTLNQSTSVELDVQYVPTVSVVQREYSIVEGSPLSISCQVDSNPPPNIVNWRLVSDGGSLSSNMKSQQANALQGSTNLALPTRPGPVLEFERISRDLNQNIFECLAQNSYGISLPADVKLNVLYAPFLLNTSHSESVVVGSEAQLACIFDGNPEPEVKWHYTDPLARSAQAVQLANDKQQYLTIKNVTYRNEGDYHCEARNQINGVFYGVRSSNILLDVYGEPQFLNRSPQQAKALQGTKSDLTLSFCADPPPNKVYWQFGSLRLDVRLNSGSPAPSSATKVNQRFQVHPLQALQKRESSFSKVTTCFEAQLSILDPELTDQRDYTLVVQNERGHQAAVVRLRVSSPLSPVLMITSAFVTICGLFLCSLIVMFLVKKRNSGERAGSSDSDNSRSLARLRGMEKGGVEHLANGNGTAVAMANAAAAAAQLIQQQTRGLVNGTGNGLANGASNPTSMMQQSGHLPKNGKMITDETGAAITSTQSGKSSSSSSNNNNNLLSMASSSDGSSSGDQKQLLANSDRQSSVSSTSDGGNFNLDSSPITSVGSGSHRSTAVSTPSPMNHISVDDDSSCTYQAALPDRAQLEAQLGSTGGIIYANIDYSDLSSAAHNHHQNSLSPTLQHSPQILTHLQSQQQLQNLRNQMSQSSPSQSSLADQSIASVLASNSQQQQQQQANQQLESPQGIRSNVGATIALMNSLAAQAANQKAISIPGGTTNGVLNGAINQQLASNRQLTRKTGPPKPPKPTIQQRSRFYTQQQPQQQQTGNGLPNNNGLVMIGSSAGPKGYLNSMSSIDKEPSANELAVEYSRIAFPARAEL